MMKTLFNKIITFVTLFSFLVSPANALNFSFDYSDFGTSGNYKKSIVYTLLAALNASNTAPLTALTGTNLTQTATSPVVIPNSAGTLITLPAGYPAVPGATYTWDTAQGATLGTELITVAADREFSSDTGFWKDANAVSAISGGALNFNSIAALGGKYAPNSVDLLTVGQYYQLTYTLSGYVSGEFKPWLGFTQITTRTANGTYTEIAKCTTDGAVRLYNTATGNAVYSIDNVSIKLVIPAVLAPGVGETAAVLVSGLTRYTGGPAYNPGLGVLAEQSYTAHGLHSRDLSNAAWVKTNCTGVKNATGTGGVANTASTLTATANDATALQTVTLANGARGFYPYIKRKTGTGGVFVTIDNGGTWSEITSSLATDAWYRASSTKTAADPIFGFKLAVSGDAIEVDYANQFSVAVAQSPIETTTATVTAGPRFNPLAGSELGSKITLDATPYELGREQWILGGATSGAGVYLRASDNKVVYRSASLGTELSPNTGGPYTTTTGVTSMFDSTLAVESGEIKCTRGSSTGGIVFQLATTSGKRYRVTYSGRPGTANFRLRASTSTLTTDTYVGGLISAAQTNSVVEWVAVGATTYFWLQIEGAVAGTTIFCGAMSVKEVKEIASTDALTANTTVTIGVEQSASTGAKLYIDGTLSGSDATATTPVTWGAAPQLGANGSGASVFNGTLSVLQSSSDANFLLTSQIINLPNYEKIIYLADRKKKIKTTEEWREAA